MERKFGLVLIIALILLAMIPVSIATDYPHSSTVTISGINSNPDVHDWPIYNANTTSGKNITRIVVTGYGYYNAPFDIIRIGQVGSTDLGGINYGNYSAHVTGSMGGGAAYHKPYTADISFPVPLDLPTASYLSLLTPVTGSFFPDRGEAIAQTPALSSYTTPVIVFGSSGFVGNGSYTIYYNDPSPNPVNATLNVKEVATGTPISGAFIEVSNGQSGYSDINGNLTLAILPPSSDYTVNVTKAGYAPLDNWYLGPAGLTGGYAIFTMTPNGVAGNVTIYVRLKDSESPYALISGSTISIKNNTWFNQSAPTGALAISGADTGGLSALSIGQTITVCGEATGYSPRCDSLTIPYSGYIDSMYLTRTTLEPSYGNSNLIVTVKRNLDAQPVSNGHVTVQTGVSGPGTYEGGTDDNGIASFFNLSASSTALVNVVAQGYQPASAIVPMSPNATTRVTLQLVRIGDTPVATPVVPTATPGYVTIKPTTPIYPTSTSAIYPNPSWTPGGTTGHYSGFFGPIANWFDAMGAGTEFISTLLAVVFIFIGAAVGGWSSAPYSSTAVFNPVAAGIGALLGFLVAVAAGLISLTLVVIFIFAAIFIAIFFR